MQDRTPLYPGRVTLTPVSGQPNTYDMVRADQPTQEGTPLNKGTLLRDNTAALFGFGSEAVPDDVFRALGSTARRMTAYSTDLYLYVTGQHPVLNAGPYDDIPAIRAKQFGVITT